MLCGEILALSVMVIVAVSAPDAAGAKCPWIEQLTPTARLDPQVLPNTNEDASVPVTAMLVIVTAEVPVSVTVTACDPLAMPTSTEPYERLAAESVTGGTKPVPVNAIVCGEVLALSVMVIVATNAPPFAGAKCPWMLQLAPAARLAGQLLANTNEDASVPVTAMLVIESAVVSLLVNATYCDALAAPTFTDPNAKL